MPHPIPTKMAPPANPRREGLTLGSTVGATSTMSTPPETPDAKRHRKSQENDTGDAQAKKAALPSNIIALSTPTTDIRDAIGWATSAPAR